MLIALTALLSAVFAIPAVAQEAASPQLQARVTEMAAFLDGGPVPATYFSPPFLAQIPAERIVALAGQLRAQNGEVTGFTIDPIGATAGIVTVEYEHATATVQIVLESTAPYRVNGLLVSNVIMRNDSFAALAAEMAALPGEAGFTAMRLGTGGPAPIAGHRPDRALAVGSSFKLYVLAEAARQVAVGERRWSDAIPLGEPSRPSGITQQWPRGAPVTLHTLATLMISISDNTATDTLIGALGRERIEAMVARAGHADPGRAAPLLNTREFFALKLESNADLRARWASGGPEQRRALLQGEQARLALPPMRMSDAAGVPVAIGEVEWFASPNDIARALDWLRVDGGPEALAILAVNNGAAPGTAGEWRYLGYKGGSEAGVIAYNYLAQDREGNWYAVSGAWNDPSAPVDDARFHAMMLRALRLARTAAP